MHFAIHCLSEAATAAAGTAAAGAGAGGCICNFVRWRKCRMDVLCSARCVEVLSLLTKVGGGNEAIDGEIVRRCEWFEGT